MKRADLLRDDQPPIFTYEQMSPFRARFQCGPFDCCWLWQGSLSETGYGRLTLRLAGVRRQLQAHRLAWFIEGRSIPKGMELDHLCNNRACVNPNHLRAVTPSENTRRSNGAGARHAAQTHCKRGHAFDDANTRYYKNPTHGRVLRHCRSCWQLRKKTARAIVSAALRGKS